MRDQVLCLECRTVSVPKKLGGFGQVAMIIAGLFLVVALIGVVLIVGAFMLARPKCAACGSRRVIPSTSPKGRELLGESPHTT